MRRRLMIWAVWLLLAAEIIYLGSQPPLPRSVTAMARQGELRASVHQEKHMLTFRLEGHAPGAEPTLQVRGHSDYGAYLRFRETEGSTTSMRLSFYAVASSPAEELTYTWQAGGETVSGSYLFVHPAYQFDWKLRDTGTFRIYYVHPYNFEDERTWSLLYAQAAQYLGLEPVAQRIYLMPTLKDVYRTADTDFVALGTYSRGRRSVFTTNELARGALARVLLHEFVHALLTGGNPAWWEEGAAVWVQGLTEGQINGTGRFASLEGAEKRLSSLHRRALDGGIELMGLNRNEKPPLDPYTVGLSFMIYLKSRLGEEGLTQALRAASRDSWLDVLPKETGEPYGETLDKWLIYVRSEQFLADVSKL